jgi:peptidoglycan/LPS O-acetylase OafA/YrhL
MSGAPAGTPAAERGPDQRLDAFDGLRACAALAVVAYHSSLLTGVASRGPVAPILSESKDGVAIFFVISGFLLYLPYARAIRDGRDLPDWRGFAQRRVVRILPGYWIALTILAAGPLASSVLTADWWRYYGLAQVYTHATMFGGLSVAWSLCVEVTFYAVLPVFAEGVTRLARATFLRRAVARTQLEAIAAVGVSALLLRAVLAGSFLATVPHGAPVAAALPGMFDWFALGMALAVARAGWELSTARPTWLARLADEPAPCWLIAAAAFSIALVWLHDDPLLQFYPALTHLTIGVGAAAFVLPAVAVPREDPGSRRWPIAFLTSPAMTGLGTISYGIYLWHLPVLDAIVGRSTVPPGRSSLTTTAAVFIATVAGSVALGAASWYFVERPAQRRWRPRPAAMAPVAA